MTVVSDNQWSEGSIDGVVIHKLDKHSDNRGWLIEMFRSDELSAAQMPAMGYLSVTHAGVARGPHSHVEQTDYFGFVCSCRFEVRLWDDREGSATRYLMSHIVVPEDEPTLITIPPGVIHGYRNTADKDGIVLNFPDRLYAGPGRAETVDEVRYEDIDDCPFSMID